jgi:hypothetical protein
MSLLYQINRGSRVSVPDSARKLRGYFAPLPLEPITKHATKGHESQLFTQLRRGGVVPDPTTRIVDHDIAETMAVQDHGMKVRLGDLSINKLKSVDPMIAIGELSNNILAADPAELANLVRDMGLPVGTGNMAAQNWITQVQKGYIKPDAETLTNVVKRLQSIKFMDSQRQNTNVINTIQQASADQIQAMADVIGIPIHESLVANRTNVTKWFMELFKEGIEPSKDKQDEIIMLLDEIDNGLKKTGKTARAAPGADPSLLESSSSSSSSSSSTESKGLIITPDKWKNMDKTERTNLLKDAASRYMMTGKTIKQGTDSDKMDNKWTFITGDNGLIPNKDVKGRMNSNEIDNKNKGNKKYILNLKNFTISLD